MIKSYKLKIFANRDKRQKIDRLLDVFYGEVNYFIPIYWQLKDIKGSFPPNEMMPHGTTRRRAAIKAWEICKGARAIKQKKEPEFKGDDVDLEENQVKFCDFTNSYDFWFKLSTTEKYKRITIPCKRYGYFIKALSKGTLKKSAKIIKRKDSYYLVVFVDVKEKKSENTKKIGIDLGLTNSVATSDGKFYGESVQVVRRRTKHRKYLIGPSAQKQEWNRVAKFLAATYPETDFCVEDLLFKGKKKRTRSFRRKYNTWAYRCLSRKLGELGKTEGFKVILKSPAFTSQTCPRCSFTDKGNRQGEKFKCLQCRYENHADTVGAINVLGFDDRVPRILRSTQNESSEHVVIGDAKADE